MKATTIKITVTVTMVFAVCASGWAAQSVRRGVGTYKDGKPILSKSELKASSSKKTDLSESELRTLAKAVPDAKIGGQLYSVAMATTNGVDRQQEYLKTATACLIACGKEDIYRKHVKGKLLNAKEFERELKDDCVKCSGAGEKKRRCTVCTGGSGRCVRCNGSGKGRSVGFDRSDSYKTCGRCNGSGCCHKCGGDGFTKEKCLTCAGTGKVFSKEVATCVFRDSCNAIADGMKVVAVPNSTNVVLVANVASSKSNFKEYRRHASDLRKAEELFAVKCKADEGMTMVEYHEVIYGIGGNEYEGRNFMVISNFRNPDDYWLSCLGFPMVDSHDKWYASVVLCTEKLKSWILVSKRNTIKKVRKEIPDTATRAYVRRKKSKVSDIEQSQDMKEVKFIGAVEANDTFDRYSISISVECGDYFCRHIFSASGTIEEINSEIVKFLIFVNPESLAKARKKQAEKETMFQ